ncbi:helix-turn-helix transcriptional regulator [Gimesia sp.]|uniref:helix-turn-helix domain-containing protein n=1 Tax=Gimesia sp. TaxID=2024833 RepID=UPI000C6976F4|nr:helix-turn-helix transcriptional regulator [Gimesia sp.]MAX40051.1 hypothetical protein [Gimesia sp.]HAH47939.1 hypothetical protein [Planctomycetaceae bacterium]HBL42710.1 hypothetical protein [Planctomycetaceae bacterium]|tara:strand:+ start:1131 stop:1595 length:465 start_codon:yes stop_codon:yes gene_type:complete
MNMIKNEIRPDIESLTLELKKLPETKAIRIAELWNLHRDSTDPDEQNEIIDALVEIVYSIFCKCDWVSSQELDSIVDPETARRVESYRKKVGVRIKAARKIRNWTQQELANAAKMPQSHVSRLEQGKHAATDITIQKLADALGIPAGELDPSME